MRSRMVAAVALLVLFLLGVVTAQAANFPVTAATLTAQQDQRCAESVTPLDVRATDSGSGQSIVIGGLPAACDGLPLRVEVASAQEGTVFTGAGTTAAGTATLAGAVGQAPLSSPVQRAVAVVVDGWPMPARWQPATAPAPSTAPIFSVDPDRWAVRDIKWSIMYATQFCVTFSVENVTDGPVTWEVAADLTTAPFNGGHSDIGAYQVGWPTRADRIVADTLYLTQDATLAAGGRTNVSVCDYTAPYPAVREPGADAYEVHVAFEVVRYEGQSIATACALVTVQDLRPDEQFWIGYRADVDWGATLTAAVQAGTITGPEAELLLGKPLDWQRSGAYQAELLDIAQQVYRVHGFDSGTRPLGPGETKKFRGCIDAPGEPSAAGVPAADGTAQVP